MTQPNAAGNNPPVDRNTPMGMVLGAVEDFLTALKNRDPAALADAVALRAPTEAKVASHVPLWKAVRENNLPEEQLDQLAAMFDGFTISSVTRGSTTGQLSVQLSKVDQNQDLLMRTVYLRHEKAGWKVLDFSKAPYNYGNVQRYMQSGRQGMSGGRGGGRR